jgi:hypothetical protein
VDNFFALGDYFGKNIGADYTAAPHTSGFSRAVEKLRGRRVHRREDLLGEFAMRRINGTIVQ